MAIGETKGVIIGSGFFAAFHANAWNRINDTRITAVADLVPDKARAFAEKWGIRRVYTDPESMIRKEKPDFVDIVTRPESHLNLVSLAAREKVHVICQKPMAPSMDEGTAMVAVCAKAGVRLLMHENWRWQPWYREVKRLMVAGAVGKPYHLAFRMRSGDGLGPEPYKTQPYFREMPRLLIYEMLVHQIDTARYLAGEIHTLFCQTQRINSHIQGEDCALIQLVFANGIQGLIDGNRINGHEPSKVAMGSFRLEGNRGMIRLNSSGRLYLSQLGEEEILHRFPVSDQGYKGDSVKAAQEHYIHCLQTGGPCETEGTEYLKTVTVVEACYHSAATRQAMALEKLE